MLFVDPQSLTMTMGMECEERIADMEAGFKSFLEFRASPAYQAFLQWSSDRETAAQSAAYGGISESGTGIDSGDTAWMLMATTLVLFMTIPGQTIFFAGSIC